MFCHYPSEDHGSDCVNITDLKRHICIGTETFTVVTGYVIRAVDIHILVLPNVRVLKLQLATRRKAL